MNTIGLIIKQQSPNSVIVSQSIVDAACALNIDVVTAVNEHEDIQLNGCDKYVNPKDIQKDADFVLVVGGDGTFLAAARALYGKSIPLLGINLGHLGFLSEIDANQDIKALLKELMTGHFPLEKRSYYEATLKRGDKQLWQEPFLNDVVLQRNADEKMIFLKVTAAGAKLSESRADGLIISTPTGSTAYNLSAGGPILHPQLEGMVLAPICPHKMSLRPIVLPPLDVDVEVLSETGHISIDGQKTHRLQQGDTLTIKRSRHDLVFVKSRSKDFFTILREKLGWDIDFLQKSVDS